MIIYGWKGTRSELTHLPQTPCPSCGQPTLFSFTQFRYAHIYWIPLFPLGRTPGTACGSCKAVATGAVPSTAAQPLASIPVHHFAGLILAGVMLLVGAASSAWQSSASRGYAEAPSVGDVYVVRKDVPDKPGMDYDAWRVVAVRDDAVEVRASAYAFRHASSVEAALRGVLADDKGWQEETTTLARTDVPRELGSGRIVSIVRK